jgi:hypothetical protein
VARDGENDTVTYLVADAGVITQALVSAASAAVDWQELTVSAASSISFSAQELGAAIAKGINTGDATEDLEAWKARWADLNPTVLTAWKIYLTAGRDSITAFLILVVNTVSDIAPPS